MRTYILITSLMLALGACKGDETQKTSPGLRVDVERYQVPLAEDDFALGGEDALVTIVVFSDYACQPCRNLWDTMRRLHEDYGDDIRIVHRGVTVPGFEDGGRASEAAYAAGAQGKFWPMHWRLFEHQEDLSEPVLRAHAKSLGLDVERFKKELDEGAHSGRRLRDRRAAAKLGINAAPIVFVNGMVFVGPRPDEAMWHQLIDAEITTVREQVAAGMSRKGVYAQLQSGALDKPLPRPKEVEDLQEEVAKVKPPKADFDYSKIVKPDATARYDIPLDGAYGHGPEDAPIVVVEFTDFQCPFCKKLHAETLAAAREKYPDDLRVVVRNLPLEMHREARGAAKAAMAAGQQGRYWDFHDRIFEAGEVLSAQTFERWAAELGMDVEQYKKDFADPKLEESIERDRFMSYALGLTATPSVFVNGQFFEGFLAPAQLDELVERELAAMKEAGSTRKDWYAQRMKDARGPEQFPNVPSKTDADPKGTPP